MLNIQPPNYKFCPLCGHELSTKKEENKDRKFCPACGWHYYPRMATSAVAIIVNKDQVLMVKRNRDPYKGTWMFPAGYVDFGEHPSETIVREVKEETGLEIIQKKLIDVLQSVDDSREPGHFLYFYKVTVENGTLKNDDLENQDIQWQPIASPPDIGWVTHKEMMKRLQEGKIV